jgi:poly-gamma-glutamate synthase PgsB/CapB
MSIAPELQRIESRILHPHFYVLTNIRKDHAEHMGRTEAEQAEALCAAIPPNAVVVTTPGMYDEMIHKKAKEKGSTVILVEVPSDDPSSMSNDGMVPINLALAQKVCELAGCPPEISRQAILQEACRRKPDTYTLQINSGTVVFTNGFAVNDVPSADLFLKRCLVNSPEQRFSIVLNTRADRPLRTEEFASWLPTLAGIENVIVLGTHIPAAVRMLHGHGMSKDRIRVWRKMEVRHPHESLEKMIVHPVHLIGLGNIAGDGFELLKSLEKGRRHDH